MNVKNPLTALWLLKYKFVKKLDHRPKQIYIWETKDNSSQKIVHPTNDWKIRNRGGCISAISIVARIKEEIFVYYRQSRLEKNKIRRKLMLYWQNISTMYDGVGGEGRGLLSVPGVISRFYLKKGLKYI